MNIKAIILQEINLYFEGKAEDLVTKFSELQPAYDAGIKNPQYLQWIQKRRGGEPVEDIIGIVQAFDAAKQRLKAKGMSPDIYAYKTPAVLRQALEDLGGSKGAETRRLKDEETTYLGTFGDWVVAMPHTRESSCQLGKGTTWCTAATQSQNLFLSYVGRKKEDIILYYIMKKGSDPRQDPTAKLSVGFVNGKPVLNGRSGGVSVDAQNKGLNQRRLSQILGDQLKPIMAAMKKNSKSTGGKHPAKKQIEQIAKSKDPSIIDKYTQGMGEEERIDFVKLILDADPSPQILDKLSNDDNRSVRMSVAKNPSTPPEVLVRLSSDENTYVRMSVARNPSTPPEVLDKLSSDKSEAVRSYVAGNPSTPPELLIKLFHDVDSFVRQAVAENPSTPPELLIKLSEDKRVLTRISVAKNTSSPPEVLVRLSSDEDKYVRMSVAENPLTPLEVLVKLSSDRDRNTRGTATSNPTFIAYKNKQGIAEAPTYNEGNTMQLTEQYLKQVIREEYKALMEEKKSAKDKMKCNSPRRIRKGEPGHGKKKFVVKACDGGTEKIIRYGDAGLKIKRKQKGRRKNFRARHNCDNPGSKLKARYWSCKNW